MEHRNQILIVDDMELNRVLLCELFQTDYAVLEAENGLDALNLILKNRDSIAVILLDIVMPIMDGFQLMERLQQEGILKRIPVILITADTFRDSEINGLNLGASDIIIKPFDPHIVKKRVQNSVELYQHKNHLEDLVEHQTRRLMETNDFVVDALSTVIEYRSLESGQHIRRIRIFTRTLLEQMAKDCPEYALTRARIDTITSASAMHDIGKIAIPDSILLKPGRLTPEEFEVMKSHSAKGCEVLKAFRRMEDKAYLRYSYDICRYHHERWDGRGYPDGLKGDEIPVCAQAVSIADVYDALTSPRVYKPAYSHEKAMEMILGGECGAFSEKLLGCFKKVAKKFAEFGGAYTDWDEDDVFRPLLDEPEPEPEEHRIAGELQQASDAIRKESIERDALINAIPGGVAKIRIDSDFRVLLASDGFYKLTGYSQAEYQGLPIEGKGIRLILEEDVPKTVARINYELENDLPIFIEYRIRKKDGSIAWINAHGTKIEMENGLMVAQAVFIDMTDQKCTEQKLLSLMNSVPGGIVQIKVKNGIQISMASDGFYQMLGYSKEEYEERFPGEKSVDFIYSGDRQAFQERLEQNLWQTGRPFTGEYRVLQRDGSVAWVQISGACTGDETGEPCYQCVFTDVTESRYVREMLRMNETRYRILIEQIQDVIFEWNMRSDTMYHSPVFQRKYGYSMPMEHFFEQVVEQDIIYPEDQDSFTDAWKKVKEGQTYLETEYRIRAKDGYRWCRVKATVIRDQHQVPLRTVGIVTDVDDYKRMNALLEAKAQKDLLTGLYNKVTMESLIGECLERDGEGVYHALMILDIDDFKQINDTYGHPEGDELLRSISAGVRECFRSEDILGRAGGDEFVIFLRDIPSRLLVRDKAAVLMGIFRKLSKAAKDRRHDPKISASIGISIYPDDGKEFAELFRNADHALYEAKRQGKDCFAFYSVKGQSQDDHFGA